MSMLSIFLNNNDDDSDERGKESSVQWLQKHMQWVGIRFFGLNIVVDKLTENLLLLGCLHTGKGFNLNQSNWRNPLELFLQFVIKWYANSDGYF